MTTATEQNTYGTGYRCVCVSRDSLNCSLLRYGYRGDDKYLERCECLCHQWEDDERANPSGEETK